MVFANKTNAELISRLKTLRGLEVESLIEILWHFHELRTRELHLHMGFESLYEFAMMELGYGRDEAYLRNRASEVLALAPEFVEERLRSYRLSATSLLLAQIAFNRENERRRKAKLALLTLEEKLAVIFKLSGTVRDTKRVLIDSFPELRNDIEETKPLKDGRTQIRFGVSQEAMAKYGRLKDRLAHKNFSGRWEEFFEQLADIALAKTEPRAPKKHKGEKNEKREKNEKSEMNAKHEKREKNQQKQEQPAATESAAEPAALTETSA